MCSRVGAAAAAAPLPNIQCTYASATFDIQVADYEYDLQCHLLHLLTAG